MFNYYYYFFSMLLLFCRLVECDLWMNLVDPSECLPNHSDLCSHLRGRLFPDEREIRLDERNSPSVVSEDVEKSSEGKIHCRKNKHHINY